MSHNNKFAIIAGIMIVCAIVIFAIRNGSFDASAESIAHSISNVSQKLKNSQKVAKQNEEDDKPKRNCLLNRRVCDLKLAGDTPQARRTRAKEAKEADSTEVLMPNNDPLAVTVEMIPKSVRPLKTITFRVEGADFRALEGRLVGLNMDMGTTIITFKKSGNNRYDGKFIPSVCIEEVMEYSLKLYDEGRDLGFAVDFDMYR
ncbi:hypothetical protein [Helicobacter sp. T3_23-1056]